MTDCKKGVDTRQGNRSTTRSLGNYKHPGYIDCTPTWGCCKDDLGVDGTVCFDSLIKSLKVHV